MQKAFGFRLGAVAHPQPRGTVNALSQFHDFVSVVREFAIKCRLRCVPPRAAAIEEATQTSRAALRPGIAAVVKISVSLDCEEVSPLGSAVMPRSASFKPHTTA